jgi:hypothetical protein
MELFQEQLLKANKNLKIADHMFYVTYPLLKDYKLMPLILENIFLALTNALSALLNYELVFKRVPEFSDNFESKFNVFKEHCLERHSFDKDILNILVQVKELVLKHRKSPVEFYKNEKFVICSDDYKITTLSVEDIKKYIAKTKVFIPTPNIKINCVNPSINNIIK